MCDVDLMKRIIDGSDDTEHRCQAVLEINSSNLVGGYAGPEQVFQQKLVFCKSELTDDDN